MGNSSSAQHQAGERRWAHSYPRAGHKVLPERVPGQRLRVTDNGAILHNGGTISGRRPSVHQTRPRSSSQGSNHEPTKLNLYGSEPDLRFSGREYHHQQYNNDSPAKLRISRTRKKYKAPPAPQHNVNAVDSSSPDSYQHWEMSGETAAPSRRLRLFKTRAETKRRSAEETTTQQHHNQSAPFPSPLHRSLSSPQFQAELLEAAERLRPVREPPVGRASETPPRSPVLRSSENISKSDKVERARSAFKTNFELSQSSHKQRNGHINIDDKKVILKPQRTTELKEEAPVRPRAKVIRQNIDHRTRAEGSTGRESTPEPASHKTASHEKKQGRNWEGNSTPKQTPPPPPPPAPVKTFYFGMCESPNLNDEREEVDRFAASLQQRMPRPGSKPVVNSINTSGSDSLSSENAEENTSHSISLQLRPMLPRKQLDIPRFSPTAAWRLLSALESPPPSEEDDLVPLEERIPAPLHLHHPPGPDKSGDSGISGDASPQHQDSTHNSQVAWTPQQDLEETSSDGGLESAPVSPESQSLPAAKFSPRFSLSLPRDDRLALYTHTEKITEETPQLDSFQSLKKLKRSMSGALGRSTGGGSSGGTANSTNKENNSGLPLDGNWVLSRSVPNSLNNGHNNLQRWASNSSPSSPDQEDDTLINSLVKQPSFSYLATGGHFMYLPEYSLPKHPRERPSTSLPLSKSCEDLSREEKEKLTPGITRALEAPRSRSGRKFTFQSTVRQIERRRLAEKLSREAEQKERQRLSELEAMRRVEEEFQRKREREKADIRQQLRLYSLTQGKRAQPDGADPPIPPPATQVLSEFRQAHRDYRDYRPNRLGLQDQEPVQNSEPSPKRATVHPQVVYQMPKSTQVYVNPHLHSNGSGVGSDGGGGVSTPRSSSSDNYRRNFAQGALPHSLVSSDSELSQPNTRPTSRNHRSRSNSPPRRHKISDASDNSYDAGEIRITQVNVIERVTKSLENCFKNDDDDYDLDMSPILPVKKINNHNELMAPDKADSVIPHDKYKEELSSSMGSRLNVGSIQPFVRGKSYRPIVFNPSANKVAQIASS
ncbi:uncharacterized protein LOC142322085 isoform X2 [Lycorma delicatula]|uniref:uncharacterized protein LOC142322085 isoform X2 n=1 Tax=Lycorma delicatula TaxID=130591 RepID=UPI003F519EE2